MFIVWGSKPTVKRFEKDYLESCPICGEVSKMNYIEQKTWFTLFWIPLFPYGAKYFYGCSECEQYRQSNKDEFKTDSAILTRIVD